ncbi:MAG: hypothetical protein JSV91_10135 [Phycisphaerales bacterium]|nr:MAG: hypothetical protein JSV91_10135 [Phycisphaerales bacterium]
MSQHDEAQPDWRRMLEIAGPYPIEAFAFVRDGLSYTAQRVHENLESLSEDERHVSGQQLCLGLRDFAIEKYGMLARDVLAHWNVDRTDDFGRIVFAMIDEGVMSRNDNDSMEDFRAVFDFAEAFSRDELLARIGASSGNRAQAVH